MKIKILADAKVICSNRNSIHSSFCWPTVTRLPGGALALVTSGFRVKHVCPFGKVVITYSFDEGKSWTPPGIVMDTPLDDRDAGIAVSKDKVLVTSFNNKVAFQRETNREKAEHEIGILEENSGIKLYNHENIDNKYKYIDAYLDAINEEEAEKDFLGSTYIMSEDGGFTFGEIKKAPVSAPHGPCVMPDGRFCYIGAKWNNENNSQNSIECYIMNESGEFEFTGSIDDIKETFNEMPLLSCEPHSVILPDGKIIVHIRIQTPYDEGRDDTDLFTIYQSESTDGGKTFTKPRCIGEGDQFGAPAHLLLLSDGTLISTCTVRESPFGIKVIMSKDKGETWTKGDILYENSVSLDMGYPASVELKDKSILTVFYGHPIPGGPAEIMQIVWKIED